MRDILHHLNKPTGLNTPVRAGEKEIYRSRITLEGTTRTTGRRTAPATSTARMRHIRCWTCSGQRVGHQYGAHQYQNAEYQANADDTPLENGLFRG